MNSTFRTCNVNSKKQSQQQLHLKEEQEEKNGQKKKIACFSEKFEYTYCKPGSWPSSELNSWQNKAAKVGNT